MLSGVIIFNETLSIVLLEITALEFTQDTLCMGLFVLLSRLQQHLHYSGSGEGLKANGLDVAVTSFDIIPAPPLYFVQVIDEVHPVMRKARDQDKQVHNGSMLIPMRLHVYSNYWL